MRIINADWRDSNLYKDFDYLLIDPPWNFDDRPPKAARQVSDQYEIWGQGLLGNGSSVIKVLSWCSLGKVHAVFMWVPWSILEEAVSVHFNADYNRGKRYVLKTVFTWVRLTKNDKIKFGLGHSGRVASEGLLVWVLNDKPPINLQMRTVVHEYSGKRTRKPKNFEVELMTRLPGKWRYIFSGPEYEPFRNIDVDLVDICHDLKASRDGIFKSPIGRLFLAEKGKD